MNILVGLFFRCKALSPPVIQGLLFSLRILFQTTVLCACPRKTSKKSAQIWNLRTHCCSNNCWRCLGANRISRLSCVMNLSYYFFRHMETASNSSAVNQANIAMAGVNVKFPTVSVPHMGGSIGVPPTLLLVHRLENSVSLIFDNMFLSSHIRK
jgi:hypothetical protein